MSYGNGIGNNNTSDIVGSTSFSIKILELYTSYSAIVYRKYFFFVWHGYAIVYILCPIIDYETISKVFDGKRMGKGWGVIVRKKCISFSKRRFQSIKLILLLSIDSSSVLAFYTTFKSF